MLKRSPLLRKTPMTASATVATLRPRRCKQCKTQFNPRRQIDPFCMPACGDVWAALKAEKIEAKRKREERAQDKQKRADQMTLPELRKAAQEAFNAFIRARDYGKPCICCGEYRGGWSSGGVWDAGHFRSRGAARELAFHEDNCHAQLKRCNRRAWDVAAYRANLIERIGLARVEALEGHHESTRYTREDYINMKKHYAAKARELQKQREDRA